MSILAAVPFTEAEYPSKLRLSRSEAMVTLSFGPVLEWFRPFAEHAGVAPRTAPPWGIMHIHGEWDEPPVWENVGFWSPDELRWGMERLYAAHDWHLFDVNGYLNDHECHGVFWWLPSDPRLLRLPMGVTSW